MISILGQAGLKRSFVREVKREREREKVEDFVLFDGQIMPNDIGRQSCVCSLSRDLWLVVFKRSSLYVRFEKYLKKIKKGK